MSTAAGIKSGRIMLYVTRVWGVPLYHSSGAGKQFRASLSTHLPSLSSRWPRTLRTHLRSPHPHPIELAYSPSSSVFSGSLLQIKIKKVKIRPPNLSLEVPIFHGASSTLSSRSCQSLGGGSQCQIPTGNYTLTQVFTWRKLVGSHPCAFTPIWSPDFNTYNFI